MTNDAEKVIEEDLSTLDEHWPQCAQRLRDIFNELSRENAKLRAEVRYHESLPDEVVLAEAVESRLHEMNVDANTFDSDLWKTVRDYMLSYGHPMDDEITATEVYEFLDEHREVFDGVVKENASLKARVDELKGVVCSLRARNAQLSSDKDQVNGILSHKLRELVMWEGSTIRWIRMGMVGSPLNPYEDRRSGDWTLCVEVPERFISKILRGTP